MSGSIVEVGGGATEPGGPQVTGDVRGSPVTFGTFFDSAPDALVIVDPDGRVVRVNAQTERLFGFSRSELVGQAVERLLPERFRERHVRHRVGYASSPRPRPMGAGLDLWGLRRDGTEFPVDISLSPFETEEGVFFAAAIREATEQKHVVEARPGPVLLAPKFHAPPAPAAVVTRPRLIRLLEDATTRKLALLSAPVGSGKTTLLRAWNGGGAGGRLVAWVSLDEGDNDPVLFWSYVVEALRAVAPALGAQLLSALNASDTSVEEVVLPRLVNRVAAFPEPVVLVIDDYHVISRGEIHQQMRFLLAHLPDTLRLVLVTRADPPLPLARLRARGELGEVRAGDLSFTEPEAAELLNETLGLALADGDVARLRRRTEGWAAGLYLAGLSLRGRTDPGEFIEALAADDRHLIDYLWAEVLDQVPEHLASFLLRTSILDRLCGPLCDAVTQTTGSARVLEELEHSNRFVVALDARGEWYRYQQLFAELLRGELTRTEPELVPVLHRRASAWHRDVGSPSEAIHYSLAGNDVPSAAELIARHWRPFVNEGQVATVAGWLDALPENAITADAHLCVARAAVAVVLGQPEDAERFLAVAESVDDPDAQPEGGSSVGAAVATLRALEFRLAGDLGEAAEEARRAVKWEPESSPWRALSCVALGGTLYWLGETTEARTRLEEAVRAGQSQNDRHFSVVWALGHLAAISCDEEDVARAEELARRSLALAEEHGLAEHYVAAIAHITLGRVFEHRGVLDDAERHFARGLELARRFRAPAQIAYSLLAMARIRGSRGDRDGALPYLREARLILQRSADLGVVERVLTEVARDLAAPGHRPGAGRTAELTDREGHILRLLRSDLTQREIADQLYVSVNTMKTHTRSLYRKLGASSRAEALARARELGLL